MHQRVLIFSAVSLIAVLLTSGGASANQVSDMYEGRYTDGEIQFEAVRLEDGYHGTLELNGTTYPVQAGVDSQGALHGEFGQGRRRWRFSATLEGNVLRFTSGEKQGRLERQALLPYVGVWSSAKVKMVVERRTDEFVGLLLLPDRKLAFVGRQRGPRLICRGDNGEEFTLQRDVSHIRIAHEEFADDLEDHHTRTTRLATEERLRREAEALAERVAYARSLVVIPAQWDDAQSFSERRAAVKNDSGNWGFIDPLGVEVISCSYERVGKFSEGLACVKGSQCFFINMQGARGEATNFQRSWAEPFAEGMAYLHRAKPVFIRPETPGFFSPVPRVTSATKPSSFVLGNWEFLDTRFSEGFVPVARDAKLGNKRTVGLMDQENQVVVVPGDWATVKAFSAGLAPIQDKEGLWGFVDHTGSIAIPPQWKAVASFSEGFAAVNMGDADSPRWGYIDPSGTVVIDGGWQKCGPFQEGLAAVKDLATGKFSFIDQQGNLIAPPKWDHAGPFSQGLAHVQRNNKYGYVDRSGREVIEPMWLDAHPFSEGLAAVKDPTSGKWAFIVSPTDWSNMPDHGSGIELANLDANPIRTASFFEDTTLMQHIEPEQVATVVDRSIQSSFFFQAGYWAPSLPDYVLGSEVTDASASSLLASEVAATSQEAAGAAFKFSWLYNIEGTRTAIESEVFGNIAFGGSSDARILDPDGRGSGAVAFLPELNGNGGLTTDRSSAIDLTRSFDVFQYGGYLGARNWLAPRVLWLDRASFGAGLSHVQLNQNSDLQAVTPSGHFGIADHRLAYDEKLRTTYNGVKFVSTLQWRVLTVPISLDTGLGLYLMSAKYNGTNSVPGAASYVVTASDNTFAPTFDLSLYGEFEVQQSIWRPRIGIQYVAHTPTIRYPQLVGQSTTLSTASASFLFVGFESLY